MFNRADGRSTGTTIVAGDQYHIGLGFGHAGCNRDRKSTRLNSSHSQISYAVFCLKKKIALEKGAEMLSRKIVAGEPGMLAQAYLKRGCLLPMYSSESEQMTYVVQRALQFLVGCE